MKKSKKRRPPVRKVVSRCGKGGGHSHALRRKVKKEFTATKWSRQGYLNFRNTVSRYG
jgi:hypothetical protein